MLLNTFILIAWEEQILGIAIDCNTHPEGDMNLAWRKHIHREIFSEPSQYKSNLDCNYPFP